MSSEKDDIKTTKHLYQSFPEEMKCGTQFTITINKKTEKELYHHLHKIEETQPLADYIRLAVYKYPSKRSGYLMNNRHETIKESYSRLNQFIRKNTELCNLYYQEYKKTW